MNKNILRTLCLIIVANVATAYYEDNYRDVKIRGYAFIPTGDRFKDIYGKVAGGIQVEVARNTAYECLQLWANIDGLLKHGHSIGLCNPTKVGMVTFSFGVKVPFQWGECNRRIFYLGLGPSIAGIFIRNKSACCGCERATQGSGGVVVKSGIDFFVGECAFIDLFADYNYQPARFNCCTTNVGGLRVGLGLGSTF